MATQIMPQTGSIIYQWPEPGEWTYEDYARLPDDGRRYEVIGGNLYVTAAPSTNHQDVVLALAATLRRHVLKASLGKVYIAPIDVVIPDMTNPVQPDVLFIATAKLDAVKEDVIEGIPDLRIPLDDICQ